MNSLSKYEELLNLSSTRTGESLKDKKLFRGSNNEPDIILFNNGNIYYGGVGESGDRIDKGFLLFQGGTAFSGLWEHDQANGLGILYNGEKPVYQGGWQDDQPHGQGMYYFSNGDVYQGQYDDGEQQGYGELFLKNGSIYKGQWATSKKHGKGVYFNSETKEAIEGVWEKGELTTVTHKELIKTELNTS